MTDHITGVLADLARQRAEIDHIIVALRQLYGIPEAGAPMTVRALVEAGCIDEAVERVAIPPAPQATPAEKATSELIGVATAIAAALSGTPAKRVLDVPKHTTRTTSTVTGGC